MNDNSNERRRKRRRQRKQRKKLANEMFDPYADMRLLSTNNSQICSWRSDIGSQLISSVEISDGFSQISSFPDKPSIIKYQYPEMIPLMPLQFHSLKIKLSAPGEAINDSAIKIQRAWRRYYKIKQKHREGWNRVCQEIKAFPGRGIEYFEAKQRYYERNKN